MSSNHNGNPSKVLTKAQVDAIVDRLLEGKACKRPVTGIEAWRSGLFRGGNCTVRDYVTRRWKLTESGTTRRTNSITQKVSAAAATYDRSNPNTVWEVRCGYWRNETTYIMGPGKTEADLSLLRQQAWLMWGWLWADGTTTANSIQLTQVGVGGIQEMGTRLNSVLEALAKKEQSLNKNLEEAQRQLAAFGNNMELARGMIQSIQFEALEAQMAAR